MNGMNKTKRMHYLIFFCVMSVVLTALQFVFGAKFAGERINFRDLSFSVNTLNGVLQTVVFVFCVLMIFLSTKRGAIASCIIIGISFIGSTRASIMSRSLESLPGSLNCILFLIAIVIISKQFMLSERRAILDEVTGIPNSKAFSKNLYRSIIHNERGYLLFVHLDGFISIITNQGREVGDEILRIIAERLVETFGKDSKVYRIDGAEFAILLPENSEINVKSEYVLSLVEKPIIIHKNDIATNCYLTAYVGIAPYLNNDLSAENLIKRADIAMNYAVKSHTDKIMVFNDKMKEQMEREVKVEGMIKDSLKNDYFTLVYQPQYTTMDKRLRGFETLIRMHNPNGESVPPGEFISVAEKSELILSIDDYVLRRAMGEFRDICNNCGNTITVAINVSATDIAREGFADRLLELIDEIEFPAECLEIEITEYSFAEGNNHTIDNICKLRDHQIMIALDDFGTGYTSLEQLMKLPVNLLKLDKSLIDNVAKKTMNKDFVKSVIYMGHLLDTEVIAEGVEDEEQLEMLRNLDCDFTQGYLWGRPMEYENAKGLAIECCCS